MSKRIFTQEQIKELLENPNVKRCSNKSVTYSREFKIMAVRLHEQGTPPLMIFMQAGFNIDILGRDVPGDSLFRWRMIFGKRGIEGFSTETRGRSHGGGRPRTNWQNEKEKIKYLETQIAYLKAENDFLAKLRKKS